MSPRRRKAQVQFQTAQEATVWAIIVAGLAQELESDDAGDAADDLLEMWRDRNEGLEKPEVEELEEPEQ